ncbi:MAG: endolytic transglycosylase MltG [Patescibacteria group bacterium]
MDENQNIQQSVVSESIVEIKQDNKKAQVIVFSALVVLLAVLSSFFPPKSFPVNTIVHIENGTNLQAVSLELERLNVIRSPFIFRIAVILMEAEKNIIAGDYLLEKKLGVLTIAKRLTTGESKLEDKKLTIPEGWGVIEIGNYLEQNLVGFDKNLFYELAKTKEGYLFPDTYFFHPSSKPDAVIEKMETNFEEKILAIPGIKSNSRNIEDIIIMASILEGEAKTTESRKIVAGILWKRISIDMPLQVDATFKYINGKNTYELSLDDLQIDSPYNTYKYRGLPPTPINNPGLDSILAAMNPTKTNYLYFLSSKDGKMYYATNFEGHQVNRDRYLR